MIDGTAAYGQAPPGGTLITAQRIGAAIVIAAVGTVLFGTVFFGTVFFGTVLLARRCLAAVLGRVVPG